ncbi:MAG: hypothetical protein LBH01_04195 [Verrucomicrobiales bacterium]|jgi:hypothetical protein|nr:hypothetical protein [Verrucomicrobiales bacterium]
MHSIDDFNYAMEQTRVILPPEKRLETFGTSVLNYYLITEDMDSVNLSRVREGSIEAARPQIVSPATFSKLMLEGFGEQASRLAEAISANPQRFTFLKYGFTVKKNDIRMYEAHEPVEAVIERVRQDVAAKADPLSAIIKGVDDAWEVCLLKFMLDTAGASGEKNIRDMRDRGLL